MKTPLRIVSASDVSKTHVMAQNVSDHAQNLRSADGDIVSILPGTTIVDAKFKHEFDPMRVRFKSVAIGNVTGVRNRPVTLRTIERAQ